MLPLLLLHLPNPPRSNREVLLQLSRLGQPGAEGKAGIPPAFFLQTFGFVLGLL